MQPRKLYPTVRRIVIVTLSLTIVTVLATAAWIVYTQIARTQRETHTPDQLAAGKGRRIPVEGGQIYLREWGNPSDPVVLLVHGTGAWSGTWFTLPDALAAARWHVVAIDLPPFGLSAMSEVTNYTRAAQARRILAVIEQLEAPVTLVGHSFGSGPALEAAMHGGERIRQLVLVDPALGLGPKGEPPRCEPGGAMDFLLGSKPLRNVLMAATATWPGLTATLLRQFVHRKEQVTAALVPAYQIPLGREHFTSQLGDWAVSFSHSTCERADSLDERKLTEWASGSVPVALIWGAEDAITPVAQAEALRRWMPRAELTVLPGVGHIPHIENPGSFEAALVGTVRQAR